jgi:excisionase family DNA binding protein
MTNSAGNAPEIVCQTFNIQEAAKILGVGRNELARAIKQGHIKVTSIPGCRSRVPRAELDRLLAGIAVGGKA